MYTTFDETSIPLSNTARNYINQMRVTPDRSTKKTVINSTVVVNILLRRAPAPDVHERTKEQFTSTRSPGNPNVSKAHYERRCQRLFGNFLSPTQAARSRQWKNAHEMTFLKPVSDFEASHRLRGHRDHRHHRDHRNHRDHRDQIGSNHNITHNVHSTYNTSTSNRRRSKRRKRNKNNNSCSSTKSFSLPSITSGEFYKDRRKILKRLDQNNHLQMLQDRKIRMQSKLEETLGAWKHMHSAVGSAMESLLDSEPTPKEGQRKYPRLLQSLERNRRRLQRMLEKMTVAVKSAADEEKAYIQQIRKLKEM